MRSELAVLVSVRERVRVLAIGLRVSCFPHSGSRMAELGGLTTRTGAGQGAGGKLVGRPACGAASF